MTIIEMTREEIAQAIEQEAHLGAGAWACVDPVAWDREGLTVGAPECKVCAVGAVVRRVLDRRQSYKALFDGAQFAVGVEQEKDTEVCVTSTDPSYADEDTEYALGADAPLCALSIQFEARVWEEKGRNWKAGLPSALTPAQWGEVRADVATWVRGYFPDVVKIDIGGALHAQDVRVV